MPRYSDLLQFVFSDTYAGLNYVNARLGWHDVSEIATEDVFEPIDSETMVYGAWWRDAGDAAMSPAAREPRVICKKGKATFTATGKTVILRVFINPGFGVADVLIDGVAPSTISGVLDAKDTISAASEYWELLGNEYIDIVVADNLPDTTHTVELFCNNLDEGTGGFFPISGFKTLASSPAREFENWIMPFNYVQNNHTVKVKNISGNTVKNVTIGFPAGITDGAGDPLGNVDCGDIAAAGEYEIDFAFEYDAAATPSGAEVKELTIYAEYYDADGEIEYEVETIISSHNEALITYSADWTLDSSNGENRAFADLGNRTATMAFAGDNLVVRIQKDTGWGKLNTKIDGVVSTQLNCNDAEGGGFYVDTSVAVTGTGSHTLELKSNNALPAPFSAVKYTVTLTYSVLEEVCTFDITKKNVPPQSLQNVSLVNGQIVHDAVNTGYSDDGVPESNIGANKITTYYRVLTYCVYYSSGKEDILSQYDIVIIEPHAVSRALVQRLQSRGIKVLGYVSFGEEDGTIFDPYDPGSDKGPWVGDGTGPGGYAGYYNKGGNDFAEQSECANDRQRYEGVKACAQSREEYYTGTGRCSRACQNDWREGYEAFSTGGQCSAGYTSENNWIRTASVACQNAECPQYDPLNSNCPLYEQAANGWGQDFSMMVTDYPDENGIWKSFYIDATDSTWKDRIQNHYLKSVLDEGDEYTDEECTVLYHAGTDSYNIRVTNYPIDPEATITVKTQDGTYSYQSGTEFSFDAVLGVFKIAPLEDSPPVTDGTVLKVSYTRLGLECDGVFMDTVDTVDVYPSATYQTAFSDLINDMKAAYPTKDFCSNRGFTILNDIIASCSYVMFETFISEYNWETGEYFEITDPDTIAYNNAIHEQLAALRESNVFDVFALNYCSNGSEGDALRQKIADVCRNYGYMSWSSTILLNDPLPNDVIESPVTVPEMWRTNEWRTLNVKPIS